MATDDRYGLYTRYMRGQIRQYLENHLRIAPDAVVLVATLHSRASGTDNGGMASMGSNTSAGALASPPEAEPSSNEEGGSSSGSSVPQQAINGSGASSVPQQATNGSGRVSSTTASGSSTQADSVAKERLLGTVELAFTQETRTMFLTLNPPKVPCTHIQSYYCA